MLGMERRRQIIRMINQITDNRYYTNQGAKTGFTNPHVWNIIYLTEQPEGKRYFPAPAND